MKAIFTRDEVLGALTLHPCHITGMHTPEHHVAHRSPHSGKELEGYVCEAMLKDALQGLLKLIGATVADLPHALHNPKDCGWCRRVPSQEHYRAQLRRSYEWAGEPISKELRAKGSER